jgi:hypothetical protein
MRCDERYRSRAGQQVPSEAYPDLCPAELMRVSSCQARPELRELHFDVDGTPWSWCFPPYADSGNPPAVLAVSRLVLRPGPHGLRAQGVADQPGHEPHVTEIDLAAAAGLALSSVPVYVHRFLLGRINTQPGEHGRAQASRAGVPSAGGRR